MTSIKTETTSSVDGGHQIRQLAFFHRFHANYRLMSDIELENKRVTNQKKKPSTIRHLMCLSASERSRSVESGKTSKRLHELIGN